MPEGKDGGSTRGPKGLNLFEVWTFYASGPKITITETARKFGCSREYLSRVASREGWDGKRAQLFTNRSQSVQGAVDREIADRAGDIARELTEGLGDALKEHAGLADDGVGAARELITAVTEQLRTERASGKKLSLKYMAETLKLAGEAADKFTRLARDVRGIRPGESSSNEGEAEDNRWEVERRIVGEVESAAS